MDGVAEPWWTDLVDMLALLERCDDDVAAFLVARDAFTPDELRSLAGPLGITQDDNIRVQTINTVIAARRLGPAAADTLRTFVKDLRTDRAGTSRAYLDSKGRTNR